MRLFIAVNFSDATRRALVALQRELQAEAPSGRFPAPEHLHLTLAFLGECDGEQLAVIPPLLDDIVFAPFEIRVNRIGRFRREGGDICWAGLEESGPLETLQKDLVTRLRRAGFSIESRKFSPHITLARRAAAVARAIAPIGERITKIELMQSRRLPGGALRYTAIYAKEAVSP